MNKYLIDSNVLIDFCENKIPENGAVLVENAMNDNFLVSVITYVEVLGFSGNTAGQHALESLMQMANIMNINEKTIEKTIALRKKRKIKLPDAFIAATAITNNLTLLTRNTADFEKIEGLTMLNPSEFIN